MRRPVVALQAHRLGPLERATRTFPVRVERIPHMATTAHPTVVGPGIPTALRAAYAPAAGGAFPSHLRLGVEVETAALFQTKHRRTWRTEHINPCFGTLPRSARLPVSVRVNCAESLSPAYGDLPSTESGIVLIVGWDKLTQSVVGEHRILIPRRPRVRFRVRFERALHSERAGAILDVQQQQHKLDFRRSDVG